MATIVTASGRTRALPDHVNPDEVVGLDPDGRIVVYEPWMSDYAFGLTLCCDAYDKGAEWGIVCRACYGDEEAGAYLWRDADGGFEGLDPLTKVILSPAVTDEERQP